MFMFRFRKSVAVSSFSVILLLVLSASATTNRSIKRLERLTLKDTHLTLEAIPVRISNFLNLFEVTNIRGKICRACVPAKPIILDVLS